MAGENAVAAFPAPVAAPVVPALNWKMERQKVEFNPKTHKYRMNGIILPSVTTVLGIIDKPALVNWAAGQAAEYGRRALVPGRAYTREEIDWIMDNAKKNFRSVSQRAKDSGTIAHDWIEADAYGLAPELPTDIAARNSVLSWKKWVADNGVEFLEVEKVVAEPNLGFAGTIDFIARIRSMGWKIFLGDVKTSAAIYREYELQTGAYCGGADPLITCDKITGGRIIVRIPKEGGEADVMPIARDWRYDYEAFLACLKLYRWQNDEGEWEKAL
jgi:hypothetical protein